MNSLYKYLFILIVTLKYSIVCVAAMPSSATELDGPVSHAPEIATDSTEAQTVPPPAGLLDYLTTTDLRLVIITEKGISFRGISSEDSSAISPDATQDTEDPILERFTLHRKVTGTKVEYFKTYPHLTCPHIARPVKIYSALIEDGALRLAGDLFHFYKIKNPQGKTAHMLGTTHAFSANVFPKIVMECLTQASTVMVERNLTPDLFSKSDRQFLIEYGLQNIVGDLDLSENDDAKILAQKIKEVLDIEVDLKTIDAEGLIYLIACSSHETICDLIYKRKSLDRVSMDYYYAWHAYKHSKPLLPLESLSRLSQKIPETFFETPTDDDILANLQETRKQLLSSPTPGMLDEALTYKLSPLKPLFIESGGAVYTLLRFLAAIDPKCVEQDLQEWLAHRNLEWVQSIKAQMVKQNPDETTLIAGGARHMQFMDNKYIPTDMPQLLLSEGFKVSRYDAFTGKWTAVPPLATAAEALLETTATLSLETAAGPAS